MSRKPRSLTKWALLVFVGAVLFYSPFLGSYGLFDPWETHYAEVGRTMVQRQDYISTFWQDNGFYSKPVLTFWLQAAGMKLAGLSTMGAPHGEMATTTTPEWATRLPIVLIAALGVAALFWLLACFFGRLAGGLGALLLLVTPHFALVARQTITDMPFLGFLTAAMAFFTAGFLYDPKNDQAPLRVEGRSFWFSFSSLSLLGGVFLLTVVGGQYLLFAPNVDASFVALGRRWSFSGYLVFLPYLLLVLDGLIALNRDPEGRGSLYIMIGFAFSGLGILAKGFGALFIPAAVFGLYFLLTGEYERLKRFDLLRGLFVVVAVSFPWHHAMIVRHGGAFFQEYFVHHHLKRAALGVHGERGLFTYYLNQMLFGLLPLLPLLPGTLLTSLRRGVQPKTDGARVRLILALWALVAFFLFSLMLTKFHHYILPVTVPLAALSGLYLKDLIKGRGQWGHLLVGALLMGLALRELFLDPAHMINLFIYKYERLFPYELGFALPFGVLGGLVLVITLGFLWRPRLAVPLYLGSALLFTGYLIYSYIPAVAPHWSQKALHRLYFTCRKDASERFIAWQLNWRGENFYSKNKVLPYVNLNNKKFFDHIEHYRTTTPGKYGVRYLLLNSSRRFKKLQSLMDKRFYTKYPHLYQGKDSTELVTIVGPGCATVEPKWKPHSRQKHFKVLTSPYPHNKFMLVKLHI